MIRKMVEGQITCDLAEQWAIKSHGCVTCIESLMVYPDGDILTIETVSESDIIKGAERLFRATPLCNCDLCAGWEEVESEYNEKAEFVKRFIEPDEIGYTHQRILDALDRIETGFFEDE